MSEHGPDPRPVFTNLGSSLGRPLEPPAEITRRSAALPTYPELNQGETLTHAQPVVHVFRKDCQQMSAHPSDRNASWISARFSYRTRKRRN